MPQTHWIDNEKEDTAHRLELPNPRSLTFRQINTAKNGAYTITKTYVTDPRRNTVLIDVNFETKTDADLYVYYDPSLNNSGLHDSGSRGRNALLTKDENIASALISSCGFSDAMLDLDRGRAAGNIVHVAKLNRNKCTLALGFGENTVQASAAARASLARGFAGVKREYEAGWQEYVSTLPVIAKHQQQFNMAAMVLKGLEDKTYRGAVIASPSTPWGGGPNANEPNTTGYHGVWSRDLYHIATAFDAMGDRAIANRLLDYLFKVQQKLDGSFPQNSWVDGDARSVNGLQMDQVALPLVLAYQLRRNDRSLVAQSHQTRSGFHCA